MTNEIEEMRRIIAQAKTAHHRDIDLLSELAIEWARDFDLVNEYNDFIDGLNHKLLHNLHRATRPYTVYKRFTVTVYFDVDAADEEDAIEMADDESVDLYTGTPWEVHNQDYDDTWVREA